MSQVEEKDKYIQYQNFFGQIEKQDNQYVLKYKDKNSDQENFLKVELSENQIKTLSKWEENGLKNKSLVRVPDKENEKSFVNIYSSKTNINNRYYEYFSHEDKEGKKRANIKSMTRPISLVNNKERIIKELNNKPFSKGFVSICIKIKDDHYIEVPGGRFSPQRKNLSGEQYYNEKIMPRIQEIMRNMKRVGINVEENIVAFYSHCENINVKKDSPIEKTILESIEKQEKFYKEHPEKQRRMTSGYLPTQTFIPKDSDNKITVLSSLPVFLSSIEHPMIFIAKKPTEEEKNKYHFVQLENLIEEIRNKRLQSYEQYNEPIDKNVSCLTFDESLYQEENFKEEDEVMGEIHSQQDDLIEKDELIDMDDEDISFPPSH